MKEKPSDLFSYLTLEQETLRTLREKSLGIVTLDVFAECATTLAAPAFLFCIDSPKGRLNAVAEKYGLYAWKAGTEYFEIDKSDFSVAIENYLQAVITSVFPIVFFITPDIVTHKYANVTRYELLYFLLPEHQAVLARILFVLDMEYLNSHTIK